MLCFHLARITVESFYFFNPYRFFVLNNEAGLLEYFVTEQSRNQKPRGTLQLAGAVISPSDEDSHTFTVNAASGEQYKLRGTAGILEPML